MEKRRAKILRKAGIAAGILIFFIQVFNKDLSLAFDFDGPPNNHSQKKSMNMPAPVSLLSAAAYESTKKALEAQEACAQPLFGVLSALFGSHEQPHSEVLEFGKSRHGGYDTSNQAPNVSPITNNAVDTDTKKAGLQIDNQTAVTNFASASDADGDALIWTWSYTINDGNSVVAASGSGEVAPVTYGYSAVRAPAIYTWTLAVSDGRAVTKKAYSVEVRSDPMSE